MASVDRFGRDLKLRNGNFSSRILCVRIHELEPEDVILIEGELGGALRSIDFIYKSPGVNRPLRYNEEEAKANINHTLYRDQITPIARVCSRIFGATFLTRAGKMFFRQENV